MRSRTCFTAMALVPAFWLAALATGCAGAPPKEAIASAQTLIKSAEQDGAAQFAPAPLREAKDKITRAESEVGDDDYDDARRLAEQAQADAKLAAVESDRVRTQEAVSELSRTVQALESDLGMRREPAPLPPEVP